MKQFATIEKLDTGILYLLELASSLSVLLLAFGLIASMANVLIKGSVLTDNLFMQRVWAWTQCIAIDASVAGTIIRTFRYHQEGEKVKTDPHPNVWKPQIWGLPHHLFVGQRTQVVERGMSPCPMIKGFDVIKGAAPGLRSCLK